MRYFKKGNEEVYVTPYFVEYHKNTCFLKGSSLKKGTYAGIINALLKRDIGSFIKIKGGIFK